jgi:GntR family transcriptional regulator, arabinose operon transcriptional repressor
MNECLLKLDLGDGRVSEPKYERLKNHLITEMLAGRLKPGQALPSEQHFAKSLRISTMTVRQAMASLADEGLIRRVPRRGSFVEADARQKLRRGQDLFALVVPETRGGYYASLLHGFEDAAGGVHHQTITCNSDNNLEQQASIILQLLDKEIGGVAIVPTYVPPTPVFQIRQLQNRGIPVVLCQRRVEGIAAPLVAFPYREVGRLAGQTLAAHGHRRVAFFTRQPSKWAHVYEEGLQEGLGAGGCDVPAEMVVVGESIVLHEEMVLAALQRVLANPDRPTAIFASIDLLAEMIYLLLLRLGLRVPEDISLLGVGDTWREGAITRRLTSVAGDAIAMGHHAVSLLHEMRRGERAIDDDTEIVLELRLSEGTTLASPPEKREFHRDVVGQSFLSARGRQ